MVRPALCLAVLFTMIFSFSARAEEAPPNDAIVAVALKDAREGEIVTFGQAFRRGDWPRDAALAALAGGERIPLQADVKTRYADGSVQHAILTLRAPKGDGAIVLARTRTALPDGSPVGLKALLDAGYDVKLALQFDGVSVEADAAALLAKALSTQPNAHTDGYWMRGPLASELRVEKRVTPQMRIVFDIRALADGTARTSVIVRNDAFPENDNQNFAYDADITAGGESVLHQHIVQIHHSTWRAVTWTGGPAPRGRVVFDMGYWERTRLIPSYDLDLGYSSGFLNAYARRGRDVRDGPMQAGDIMRAMGTTGYRADLGMTPAWTAAYILGQQPAARDAMLANADDAGSIPWHFREADGGAVRMDKHPRAWLDYRANKDENGHNGVDYESTGWGPDTAHQPSLNYVPYLITGDHYSLDELQDQAAWDMLYNDPRYRPPGTAIWPDDQVRGQGWTLRTIGYAAEATPDGDPLKAYFATEMKNRLAWFVKTYIEDGAKGAGRDSELQGWIDGYSAPGELKTFMQDFFVMPLAQMALLGHEGAQKLSDYVVNFYAGRYLQQAFDPIQAYNYVLAVGDDQDRPFKTWRDFAEYNYANGYFDPKQSEIFGYPRIASGFLGGHRAALATLASAVDDPRAAEAYAYIVSQTRGMDGGGEGFQSNGQWAIVPMFADGSVVSIRRNKIGGRGGDRLKGTDEGDLLMGMGGDDTLDGGGGTDILAGWSGDDVLRSGAGADRMAGGPGADLLVMEGDGIQALGGPGADRFDFTGVRATVHDFEIDVDQILLPADRLQALPGVLAAARDGEKGAELSFPDGGVLIFKGVSVERLRNARASFADDAGAQ